MAYFYEKSSRTFSEYLLIPGHSSKECLPEKVDLETPITKFKKNKKAKININLPLSSAIMQSVSNDTLGIALAKEGGISFIYSSQEIKKQADMVKKVKSHKAGFVLSDSNIKPSQTLKDIIALKEKTGHSTVAVTENGTAEGKLVGIITSRDYRISRTPLDEKVKKFMTPLKKIKYGKEGISLTEANDIIWENKLNALPILKKDGSLSAFVFRKDYDSHKENPFEIIDDKKRYIVGAGINTRDYKDRAPALLEAEADVLCIDSSEGFTDWQKDTIKYIKKEFGGKVFIGAGNVVDKEGFLFLAKAGADFIKVGIGGGSICITREQKGIGRGQASAIIEVAKIRNEYFRETGEYIPICSDGGIVYDYHMTLALAMGADFLMLGRYFARFDESPTTRINVGGNYMKEYWGEGSSRARNWQRYDMGGNTRISFEEGVDSLVPYAGALKDNIALSRAKMCSTMANCGASNIPELQKKAKLTVVSATSIIEGGAHDVIPKEQSTPINR
ncbi:MAG: IMP dehydrogenase [Clostridiales Family XIII bacterium]|jgi:IMP dehydrogenase|nr:IMP dehydrogenase [Clostridiales Family XIII bacterium]